MAGDLRADTNISGVDCLLFLTIAKVSIACATLPNVENGETINPKTKIYHLYIMYVLIVEDKMFGPTIIKQLVPPYF